MLVRMLTYLAWRGNPCEAGQTIDLPEREALAFIRSGQAEAIERPKEAATITHPTNAMRRHEPHKTKRG